MNSPNYPPPGGSQGPYGPPQGQPYGQRPPQTPPGGQPYGGPPPQGQPFGGPPPQGPPQGFGGGPGGPGPTGPGGAPPAAYPTPPPPAPSGKPKNTGTIIKIVAAVVVLAVVGVIYFVNKGTAPSSSKVGDCIKVNSASSTDADVEKIDCNSKDAAYKVASTHDDASASCPDGDYVSYTETGRGSDLLLCLTLNAKEGQCFQQGDADKQVECASKDATFMVTKILTGTTDVAGCPGDGEKQGYVYSSPDMVQCFGPPNGSTT
jgi:hypothetical protein